MNEQGRDYKLQGMVLMGTGNYKDAQRIFKKALEIEECADLWIDLGNCSGKLKVDTGGIS